MEISVTYVVIDRGLGGRARSAGIEVCTPVVQGGNNLYLGKERERSQNRKVSIN